MQKQRNPGESRMVGCPRGREPDRDESADVAIAYRSEHDDARSIRVSGSRRVRSSYYTGEVLAPVGGLRMPR